MKDGLNADRQSRPRLHLVKSARVGALAALLSIPTLGFMSLMPGASQPLAPAGALGPPTTVPPVTTYTMTCAVPLLGNLPLQVSIFATAPGSTQPGHSVSLHAVRTTVAIPASLVDVALLFNITTLSGQITTSDFVATNTTSPVVNSTPTAFNFGPIPLVAGQPATFTIPNTPQTVGPWTAGSGGTITYTPGEVDLTVLLSFACTPDSPVAPLATTTIR